MSGAVRRPLDGGVRLLAAHGLHFVRPQTQHWWRHLPLCGRCHAHCSQTEPLLYLPLAPARGSSALRAALLLAKQHVAALCSPRVRAFPCCAYHTAACAPHGCHNSRTNGRRKSACSPMHLLLDKPPLTRSTQRHEDGSALQHATSPPTRAAALALCADDATRCSIAGSRDKQPNVRHERRPKSCEAAFWTSARWRG
jgi:hypothetical protein